MEVNQPGMIWMMMGDKAGDNAQLQAVAEHLAPPLESRRLCFRPRYRQGKPWFRPTLRHLDLDSSDPLRPPWPDLILTIGRRPTMAALWVKQQARGRSRIVVLGRPHRWLSRFELVVSPLQYRVPPAPNVVNIALPLMRVDPARLAASADTWRPSLKRLPRPLIGVLVGGPTFPYRLDAGTAEALLAAAARYAAPGGTLYVTTSRRTPADAAAALARGLPAGARMFRWNDPDADNPYAGLLAHADGLVVTGDSVSMMTEAARLGRPMAIFELPVAARARRPAPARVAARPATGAPRADERLLECLGARRFPRDLRRVHQWLYAHQLAVPAGQPLPAGDGQAAAIGDDLRAVVARVNTLRSPMVPPPASSLE